MMGITRVEVQGEAGDCRVIIRDAWCSKGDVEMRGSLELV